MDLSATNPNPQQLSLRVDCISPFENIALAFSGGGFRAASFALGVLSYLNKLQFGSEGDTLKGNTLLHQVTFMSSASGGTIATAMYALNDAQGKPFKDFYVKLFEGLTGEIIVQHALEILSDKKKWRDRPGKSRNLINAFAMAYDEYLFSGATMEALYYKDWLGHLQEMCFNTTEFYTGLSFRQDIKMVPDPAEDKWFQFGNPNICLPLATGAKYKLGDVLASSSCFPVGFEPLVFPNDFTHSGLSADDLKNSLTMKPQTGDKAEKDFIVKKEVGFMDGGITDNQGLQSLMYADARRINKETSFKPFDFMLVNDVGSYFMKPYVNPPQAKRTGISLTGYYWIFAVVCLAALAGIFFGIRNDKVWLALLGGIFVTIPAIVVLLVWRLKGALTGDGDPSSGFNLRKTFTERVIELLLRYLTKTPVGVLKQMLIARANSIMLITATVFMKRIRQLIYNWFYNSPEWKNRGKGNHIYDLAFSSDIYRANNPPPQPYLNPSRDMQIVAQAAYTMGTTLWFDQASVDQKHSEGCIIACGQFTTCYNLLSYIEKLNPTAYDATYAGRLADLKLQLTADYEHFKTDPFFIYNQNGADYQIKDFRPLTMKDIPYPGH